jgi:hypothetical protein
LFLIYGFISQKPLAAAFFDHFTKKACRKQKSFWRAFFLFVFAKPGSPGAFSARLRGLTFESAEARLLILACRAASSERRLRLRRQRSLPEGKSG